MSADDPEGKAGEPERPEFGASIALMILLSWIGGQLIGGFLGALSGMLYLISEGTRLVETAAIEEHLVELMLPALVAGSLGGAIAMVGSTLALARPHILDTDATGIAWAWGSMRQLLICSIAGVTISSAFVLAVTLIDPTIPDSDLGPIGRLAEQSAGARWVWAIIAVTIAPVSEEFLFRGVLFSGLSKSWGIPAAAAIVSALFLMFHLVETVAFWPSTIAIAALTVGTIAARLLTNRLGPPIAMHLAYNSVLSVALVSGI